MEDLSKISGGDFGEVLRNLVLKCTPDGKAILDVLWEYSILFLILGIVAGISQCFFGYQLRKLWTAILMILLCGCSAALLARDFGLPIPARIALTAGMAIVGGLLGYFLWIAGCFLRSFAVVAVAVFAVFAVYGMQTLGLIIGLAAGLIAGILVAAFYRIGLIIYSSVFGGLLAGECIWVLTGVDIWYPGLIVGGILALAGLGVQTFMNQKPKKEAAAAGTEPGAGQTEAGGAAVALTTAEEGTDKTGTILQPGSGDAGENGTIAQPGSGDAGENGAIAQPDSGDAGENGTITQPGSGDTGENGAIAHSDSGTAKQDGNSGDIGAAADICPSCGAPHSVRAKFCMQCGQKLSAKGAQDLREGSVLDPFHTAVGAVSANSQNEQSSF